MSSGNGMLDLYDEYSAEGQKEYFKQENTNKIIKFIKGRYYTYSVEDIIREYKKHKEGFYISYTMHDCIKNLENEIKYLIYLEA
ncbi:MAG: hypothetical protein K0R54_1852 [Clostridiaceae bacterium]|jgi:hypothetical protein|nr:hypothetical protein [Clostridiaceae bacterium]